MPEPKNARGFLLEMAAEAIAPVLGEYARKHAAVVVGAAAGVVVAGGVAVGVAAGAAVGYVVEKAVNYFGPPIVGRWLDWMRGRPPAERQAAFVDLGTLSAEDARREARAAINKAAPAASPEEKDLAVEYLSAISRSVSVSLVRDRATGALSLPLSFIDDNSQSLMRLLPSSVPPYTTGATLSGTPYRLEELLGTGGFGSVYRATDPGLQYLSFAVKFCLDPTKVAYLQRERSNLERLMAAGEGDWCERIVRLFGYNLEHPTPYLLYEYVAGGDLARHVASQPPGKGLPPGEVLRLITQTAEALAYAHRHGLIHRDLKPANVLLAPSGVKLADFGIGGSIAPPPVGTQTLNQMTTADQLTFCRGAGTPLYMAPEQRRGEPPDPRHDLYSLGVMWYQFLVGDVTRELHAGWEEELIEEYSAPKEQVALIKRCVGRLKQRPTDGGELLGLLRAQSVPAPIIAAINQPAASAPQALLPHTPPSTPTSLEHPAVRRARQETMLKQLLLCHRNVAEAQGKTEQFFVWFFALILSLTIGGAVAGISWAIASSVMGDHIRNWEWLVPTAYLLGFGLSFIALFFVFHLTRLGKVAVAREKRKAKIEQIAQEFPMEFQSWGGAAVLRHSDQTEEIVRLFRAGKV